MKRLQPVALIAASANECRLRCRPKFDQIEKAEHADLLKLMRGTALNENSSEVESEFVFTFNDNGAVLKDKYFFALTTDDYGELWIERAVDCLTLAAQQGVDVPDLPGARSTPRVIFVCENENEPQSTRRYRVVFNKPRSPDSANGEFEFQFSVEGGKGSLRTVSWVHGSFVASWERKNWTFAPPPSDDLEPLLMAIIRLDEAIHLELMPYATSSK